MASRRSIICGIAAALLVSGAGPAWATMDALKTYKQAKPEKAAKASCKACHQGAVGKKGDLNAYGQALQQRQAEAGAAKLTAEDINAVPEAQQ